MRSGSVTHVHVQYILRGYVWGSQPAVFAESPDRIFIGARGELKLPDTLPRTCNGMWGSLGQRATEPKAELLSGVPGPQITQIA